jgi:DNA (cytosine-5)-methyltransferase 1
LPKFYEFFAGGGMARAGLGDDWQCLFANDFDERKCEIYRANWGGCELVAGDVGKIESSQLPDRADLVWASFPCQDLSLAGGGAGLRGERSGTFWPFWKLITQLKKEKREPDIVVLENVIGTLTSHGGEDFRAICQALHGGGYRFGALLVDAELFLPHSRPRLFVVGVKASSKIPEGFCHAGPVDPWHPKGLRTAYDNLPNELKADWIWWRMAAPGRRNITLESVIDPEPHEMRWHDDAETEKLMSMMAPLHQQKVNAIKSTKGRRVGTIYRRTRRDENGDKIQRAEVRFDDIAGCLRTPAGGSSRQVILEVFNGDVKSRLISARETARLMGLPDTYILPARYNEAYHVTGDGVAVPVVQYLSKNLLLPFLSVREDRRVA